MIDGIVIQYLIEA